MKQRKKATKEDGGSHTWPVQGKSIPEALGDPFHIIYLSFSSISFHLLYLYVSHDNEKLKLSVVGIFENQTLFNVMI